MLNVIVGETTANITQTINQSINRSIYTSVKTICKLYTVKKSSHNATFQHLISVVKRKIELNDFITGVDAAS